jgi:hypothetical protein
MCTDQLKKVQLLTVIFTANDLSITSISISQVGVYCTFYGVDGSVTPVAGGQTEPVGPPQAQTSGVCNDGT